MSFQNFMHGRALQIDVVTGLNLIHIPITLISGLHCVEHSRTLCVSLLVVLTLYLYVLIMKMWLYCIRKL